MRNSLKSILLIIGLTVLGILTLTGNAAAQGEGFICLGGALIAIPILFLIIGILIAIWVYRDAESRGMSGVLWLIVVIILGIIGLIIYLVVRKPKLPPVPPGAYPPPPGYGQPPPPGYNQPPPPPR
jgi:uncharacterized membrane protein YoaK (UPF0700 family)